MFGKLTLADIPLHEPILVVTLSAVVLGGLSLFAAITYFGKWGVLWRDWLTTVDHKRVGIMYIILALVMLFRGFSDAVMMRAQQAMASGANEGFLPPHHYDQIFTAHGVIMIFFVAMPFIVGLMNFAVPLQIGARDVAFPYLNSLSFWLTVAGAILVNISLGVGEFARTGWLAYPPLSGLEYSPGVGVDYYLWALQISGMGTLLSGVNLIATIIKMRAPGMTMMQVPVFTWTALCSNILIVAAFPILTVTLSLLQLDRYLGMHFFTNDFGGNPMMYINLIWIWGHPEVYILVLPCFGVFSEVIATFSAKRLFGYTSMVYATVAITVLAFLVWAHHFFTMGGGASVNAFFGVATMIISIPTGAKIFNWLFTMYKGRVRMETPVLWTVGFMCTFVVGGMTGVMLAIPPADFVLHNSVFLIAHFHNVIISGVLFGCFAGFIYWFPKAFGFRLDETWGKRAFWCWLTGFILAFMPLYILGFMGMTRRINHTENPAWQIYLIIAAIGAAIILVGIACQIIQVLVSIRNREALRDHTGDPWENGRTLEWSVASPAPFYNFSETPRVQDVDAYWDMKKRGVKRKTDKFKPIHMPRNTGTGFIIGMVCIALGFAGVWHIWWLAIAATLAIIAISIIHSFNNNRDYYVTAEEVQRIEDEHTLKLQSLGVKP
ncbi:cytochrome o ubiquinol oxidase subunit I [Pseudochrobactrum algeriensis]|uniref:Cytochrome o ubiquinol oxidase subunit 1 n=1 Tax=Pseudochrobactrum saccharolyticum TaxID=354352 RepID=A0A7W8AH92_9HYPH|nr:MULTISPECIES: cytochrome o ubiquinol oxidase subunit I [Pseudochrobactrum]MBX8782251.1 cytochrome o ubiquinol oxidase subunit I [Ochrobactrum sp. GRS2]MBX8813248.1 cytochrome o ubiquinol oxidase subunit I [Ochrobactrum sp. MR34]KAB0540712.1 cytochrome o ubiquinol oxidase subunit I [Pseudochrobactrum saccharolyticum]MBB5090288.1 cytochrome o ubiquinol oxidase subunit 1 [Pseudochrobactrum saccharolyticum]MDP8252191.1 cytochrome o ubiquinol oxidase subunit I [Pseudochrobactrum saccharolyticum]